MLSLFGIASSWAVTVFWFPQGGRRLFFKKELLSSCTRLPCDRHGSVFFSEEKKQKTFIPARCG
jgi:hypothetical protein